MVELTCRRIPPGQTCLMRTVGTEMISCSCVRQARQKHHMHCTRCLEDLHPYFPETVVGSVVTKASGLKVAGAVQALRSRCIRSRTPVNVQYVYGILAVAREPRSGEKMVVLQVWLARPRMREGGPRLGMRCQPPPVILPQFSMALSILQIQRLPLGACWNEKQIMSQCPSPSESRSLTSCSESMILIRLSVPRGCHAELCSSAFLSLRGNKRRCFVLLLDCSLVRSVLNERCSNADLQSALTQRDDVAWATYQSLVVNCYSAQSYHGCFSSGFTFRQGS